MFFKTFLPNRNIYFRQSSQICAHTTRSQQMSQLIRLQVSGSLLMRCLQVMLNHFFEQSSVNWTVACMCLLGEKCTSRIFLMPIAPVESYVCLYILNPVKCVRVASQQVTNDEFMTNSWRDLRYEFSLVTRWSLISEQVLNHLMLITLRTSIWFIKVRPLSVGYSTCHLIINLIV